ncbi:hypothetical protein MPTK1_5g11820 [Marchantia polymorpha subsp. ruderalis]|uniref:Uncharacterized protein n=2 Tax=Marchantia polymorpha TaxID=3197 RepID=A0AAF6BHE6_MARPO|nr:hypothetical protein MARPO_0143s0010 [Marchantia polymorpha]BBN11430.1 hypothetical protein Mp_5g11820 [Marchantia polymorpha subsp. ruderalis]|eukprot:PTQ29328.1 hypothetical protein MARPO_0143s0010 [Marchantia polymorpha]
MRRPLDYASRTFLPPFLPPSLLNPRLGLQPAESASAAKQPACAPERERESRGRQAGESASSLRRNPTAHPKGFVNPKIFLSRI